MVDAPQGADPRTGAPFPLQTQKPRWIPEYIKQAVLALGKISVPKYATVQARNTAIPTPTEGDLCHVVATKALQVFTDGQWTQIYPPTGPTFTVSTTAPTGGVNGDIHFQVI